MLDHYDGLTPTRFIRLTRAQRVALLRVYRRVAEADKGSMTQEQYGGFSYRYFRRHVQPGPDCVMVRFGSMWLGIERDGYTHS